MNNDRYYPLNTDLSFEGPTLEEERELFRKMKNGDAAARELIIKNHLLFVANEARKLARGKFPDNDVVSAANEALMEAVDRGHFDIHDGRIQGGAAGGQRHEQRSGVPRRQTPLDAQAHVNLCRTSEADTLRRAASE